MQLTCVRFQFGTERAISQLTVRQSEFAFSSSVRTEKA
jgi:hypothetical protein